MRQTIGYQIDKAELIKALNYDREQYDKGYQDGKSSAMKRKTGQWLINSDGYYPYCSMCHNEPENGKMTDYCPNCGAHMKEEKINENNKKMQFSADAAVIAGASVPEEDEPENFAVRFRPEDDEHEDV